MPASSCMSSTNIFLQQSPKSALQKLIYLDNILENLEAKMSHKLRVAEGGEEKPALAAKRRLFLRI
jgi:hypothetical protein